MMMIGRPNNQPELASSSTSTSPNLLLLLLLETRAGAKLMTRLLTFIARCSSNWRKLAVLLGPKLCAYGLAMDWLSTFAAGQCSKLANESSSPLAK